MLETLWTATWQSSILFLGLILGFRLLKKVPDDVKAWIWRLAFIKPLLALLPFLTIGLAVLPSEVRPVIDPSSVTSIDQPTTVVPALPTTESESQSGPVLELTVCLLWAFGATAVAFRGFAAMTSAMRKAGEGREVHCVELLQVLQALATATQLSRTPKLVASSAVESAMVVGGVQPTIVLPESVVHDSSLEEVRLMLAHEVAHLERRDLTWLAIVAVSQSIFFFNPLIWISSRFCRLAHESATDRRALELTGAPVHRYAQMLLRATVTSRPSLTSGALPVAEPYRSLHRRLEAMQHFDTRLSTTKRVLLTTLVLGALALLPSYHLEASPLEPQSGTPKVVKVEPSAKQKKPMKYAVIFVRFEKDKSGKVRIYEWSKGNKTELITKNGLLPTNVEVAGKGSSKPTAPPVVIATSKKPQTITVVVARVTSDKDGFRYFVKTAKGETEIVTKTGRPLSPYPQFEQHMKQSRERVKLDEAKKAKPFVPQRGRAPKR